MSIALKGESVASFFKRVRGNQEELDEDDADEDGHDDDGDDHGDDHGD